MNYLISIIPILIYLLGIKAMDALSFTNWKRLCICLVVGMLSCLAAYTITQRPEWQGGWYSPMMEELLKALFIIRLANNGFFRRSAPKHGIFDFAIAFFAEAMVYGMAIGAGFAIVENTMYVNFNPDISLVECIIRGCGTALIHMGCTALIAAILVTASRVKLSNNASIGVRTLAILFTVTASIALAAVIHYLYNLFLMPPFVQLIVTVVVFLVIFMYLYMLEERLIDRWLDISISDDIKLLGAIKEGHLGDTRAGQYLVTLRDSFNPEVFFDMLVFLQLYLELSIKAKSRLILREADLEITIPSSEHHADLERIKELRALRKNIGTAGLSVLAPLIHLKNADRWVIHELL